MISFYLHNNYIDLNNHRGQVRESHRRNEPARTHTFMKKQKKKTLYRIYRYIKYVQYE